MTRKKRINSLKAVGHRVWMTGAVLLIISLGFLALFILPRGVRRRSPPTPIPSSAEIVGQIAIIIDDNGYRDDACHFIAQIPQPIAVAILPELPYSRRIAVCAQKQDKEVLLHLPMEAHHSPEQYSPGYLIETTMTSETIVQKIDEYLSKIPHISGVNNHMGSKATEDARVMRTVLKHLQRQGLFFIDSRVTLKSVAPMLARQMNIPFAERNVFLDNSNNRAYIEKQFAELARIARREHQAIGIGHARPLTWRIAKEQMQELENQGFRFVTLHNLILSQKEQPLR